MRRNTQAICKIARNISRPYYVPKSPDSDFPKCEIYEKDQITLSDISDLIKKNPHIEGININVHNPLCVEKGGISQRYYYDATVLYKKKSYRAYNMYESDNLNHVLKDVVKCVHTFQFPLMSFSQNPK
jgi:hypothetical protein